MKSGFTDIWDALRTPPPEALKPIKGGRLSGMTDIKPMWRYKVMTEQFGPCGIGWKYQVHAPIFQDGSDGQVAVFVGVELFVRNNGKTEGEWNWSDPIPGVGGSMFISNETKGLYTSDEVVKMATTDALSVAMKMLGVGADVYMGMMDSKHTTTTTNRIGTVEGKPKGGTIVPEKGTDELTPKQTLVKKIRDKCLEHADGDKGLFGSVLRVVSEWKDKETGEVERKGVGNMSELLELDLTDAELKVIYGQAKNYKPAVVTKPGPNDEDISF